MEDKKQGKGLWELMKEEANIVYWPPNPPLTLKDISDTFELLRKQDIARRKKMDKEYTDISKVTVKELESEINKWDGNVPNGLVCNIKIGRTYQQWPIKILYEYLLTMEKEIKKYQNGK